MSQKTIDNNTRMLLFTSIETDGHYASDLAWEKRNIIRQNHYENLEYVTTPVFKLKFAADLGFDIQNYQIQLFKILDDNSFEQSRYLLYYSDVSSKVYLRVGGYVENDINLLFDYFQLNGKNKRELNRLITEWESLDKLFRELDLECLLNGYYKQSTKPDCFRSVFYINVNESTIGTSLLSKEHLNSNFSRIPLNGFLGR